MLKSCVAGLALAFSVLLAAPAWAFDTGPHAAITEQVMAMAGYSRPAADAVMVENWLTDYYTSSPTTTSSQKCPLEKLHFDDVFTPADVDAYWNTLLANTLRAALKAKQDNDVVEYYAVLGVSLHVVQDFYTHSNWLETSGYKGAGYDTTTYFQWRQAGSWPRQGVLHTGWYKNCLGIPQGNHDPHGGYTSGMNHDSVDRPGYSKAYVYAVAASYEWVGVIQNAVTNNGTDTAFLNQAKRYQPGSGDAAALAGDQDAALYVSEWIFNPIDSNVNGHWNGAGSGYLTALTPFLATWTAKSDSVYVSTFKNRGIVNDLSRGLYAPPTVGPQPVATTTLQGTVMDMSVARVCARTALGTESYFGKLTPSFGGGADAYTLRDAALWHRACTDVKWRYLTVAQTGAGAIGMKYSLGNEVGLPTPGERYVTINGDDQQVNFNCAIGGSCRWGGAGGTNQPMPASLNLSGSFFKGVNLNGISIKLVPAAPWKP